MNKIGSSPGATVVKDSRSGREVLVKGIGVLKGKLTISKRVDLTKPIAVSARNGRGTRNSGRNSSPQSAA